MPRYSTLPVYCIKKGVVMIMKYKKNMLVALLCMLPAGLQAALSYIAQSSAARAAAAQDFAVVGNVLRSSVGWGIKLEESMRGPSQVKSNAISAEKLLTPEKIQTFISEFQASQPVTASASSLALRPEFAIMKLPSAAKQTALQRISTVAKDIVAVESSFMNTPVMTNVIKSLPEQPLYLEASSSAEKSASLAQQVSKRLIYAQFTNGQNFWNIGNNVVSDLYAKKMLAPELYAQVKRKPALLALPESVKPSTVTLPQLQKFIQFSTFTRLTKLQEVDSGVQILPPYEGDNAARLLDDMVTTEIFLPEEIVYYSGNVLSSLDDSADIDSFESLTQLYKDILPAADFGPINFSHVVEFFQKNSSIIAGYAEDCLFMLQKMKNTTLQQLFDEGFSDESLSVTYLSLDELPFRMPAQTSKSFVKACQMIVKKYVTGLLQIVASTIVKPIVEQLPASSFSYEGSDSSGRSGSSGSSDRSGLEDVRVKNGADFYIHFDNTALFVLLLDYCDEHDEDNTDQKIIKMRTELFDSNKITALFWLMTQHLDSTQPLKDVFKQFHDDSDAFIARILSTNKSLSQADIIKLRSIQELIQKNKKMPNISSLIPPLDFPDIYSFNLKDVDFSNVLSTILSQISLYNKGLLAQKKITVEQWNTLITPPLQSSRKDAYAGFAGSSSIEQLYLVASLQWRQYLQQKAAEKTEIDKVVQAALKEKRSDVSRAEIDKAVESALKRQGLDVSDVEIDQSVQSVLKQFGSKVSDVSSSTGQISTDEQALLEIQKRNKLTSDQLEIVKKGFEVLSVSPKDCVRSPQVEVQKMIQRADTLQRKAAMYVIVCQFKELRHVLPAEDSIMSRAEILEKYAPILLSQEQSTAAQQQTSAQSAANQEVVDDVAPDLSRQQRQTAAAALTDLNLSGASLLHMPQETAENAINKAVGKQSSVIGLDAAKAAGAIATALVEQSSKLPEVVTANAAKIAHIADSSVDLSIQQQMAKQFFSQGIHVITFDQLSKMLTKMKAAAQVTPGLLGSLQVCLWNVQNQERDENFKKVQPIIDIVAVAAKIR